MKDFRSPNRRPSAGSPIVQAGTFEVLGWWTEEAPLVVGDAISMVADLYLPHPYKLSAPDLDRMCRKVTLWRGMGRKDSEFQVWVTDCDDRAALEGIKGIITPDARARNRTSDAIDHLLKHPISSVLEPRIREYLQGYSAYSRERNAA